MLERRSVKKKLARSRLARDGHVGSIGDDQLAKRADA